MDLARCEAVPATGTESLLGASRDEDKLALSNDPAILRIVRMGRDGGSRRIRGEENVAIPSGQSERVKRSVERRESLNACGKVVIAQTHTSDARAAQREAGSCSALSGSGQFPEKAVDLADEGFLLVPRVDGKAGPVASQTNVGEQPFGILMEVKEGPRFHEEGARALLAKELALTKLLE
jgi:hypothetical protein